MEQGDECEGGKKQARIAVAAQCGPYQQRDLERDRDQWRDEAGVETCGTGY
jgi:hypothetical protein